MSRCALIGYLNKVRLFHRNPDIEIMPTDSEKEGYFISSHLLLDYRYYFRNCAVFMLPFIINFCFKYSNEIPKR